ncbi:MAG: nuclear transport factor 2 family protein [Rubrobacteraceae bacterium]
MEATHNVNAAREMYRLFERRDNEGIRDLFDPEIEWIQMDGFPGGGRYVGADAIFDGVFSGFREEWEGWRAVVERYLDAGESVVALGFYEGTYISTGKYTRAEFAHVIEVENGRIVRFVQYTDTFKVAEAMGVVGGGY